MFNRKTLFVIGAGAGHDINMPAGRQLAEDIARRTQITLDDGYIRKNAPDQDLALSFFERGDPKGNEYYSAFRIIHNGVLLANSIDDFLNVHEGSPEVVTVGKAAIVRAILEAERSCKLYVDPSNANNKLHAGSIRDSWFVKLMQVLAPGRKVHEVENTLRDVSFITFNYDRCLEYFLQHAISLLYGIPLLDAATIVSKANIIHPYGSVGALEKVQFGGIQHARMNFRELSKTIKTYTEQIEEQDVLQRMQATICDAECIVFLGFAYHKQNMALLRPVDAYKVKQVYGTAFGMSDSDVSEVDDELRSFFPGSVREDGGTTELPGGPLRVVPMPAIENRPNIAIENNLTCTQLFDYYAKSLAG